MAEDGGDISDWRDSLRRSRDQGPAALQHRLRVLGKPSARDQAMGPLAYRPPTGESSGYARVKHDLHQGLMEILNPQAVARATLEQVRSAVEEYVDNAMAGGVLPVSGPERNRLCEDLLYEILGLGPLTPLMLDPTISDVLVNGPQRVYVERKGRLELTEVRFHDEDHLMLVIERILMSSGRRVDESSPMADARLPDGSRVNVVIPPVAVNGPVLSIRRFAVRHLSLDSLVAGGTLLPEAARFLELAMQARLSVVVSGGTGSGKTTLLNSIAEHIPAGERIITIEDTAELRLPHEHLVSLEGRPANVEGTGQIDIRSLVRNALRMRPDRIIVGEARGAEALDMLQAMNTGHEGSMTTVHANSPRDALSRLETMMLMADLELPQRVLREQIGSAVNLLVHLARLPDGGRRIMHITEIAGLDNGTILTQDLFLTRRDGAGMRMRPMGVVPAFAETAYQRGVHFPEELFRT